MNQSAEPGYTTTEFWLTTITGLLVAVFGLLAAFGLGLTDTQRAAILAVATAALPLLIAIYAVARSLRKRGTPG